MLDGVETRGVLWDVGGVLLEFAEQPTGRRRWQARLGLADGELEERLWSAIGSFGVAETEAIVHRLASTCALSPFEARQLLLEAHEHWRPNATLMTFAMSLRSAGVPTAVVSNALAAARWAFEAMLDVRRLTDVVVISAEVGVEKPDPDIYRLATDALGVDPTGCVLVDDLLENLDGAATIGIAGVLHLRNDGTMRAVRQALQ
jgi:putative hydrolase of the HAD superfamily